jgi:sterol desaturase/sphingolipid hydroxylase (fatty acid hydroxylase superfamily)
METNSNFGFCLPWWDRLCNTYRDQPVAGHEGMIIGLRELRNPERLKLHHLIMQPFISVGAGGVRKDD